MTRLDLDSAGAHFITLERREEALLLQLDHAAGDRRSAVHDALARQLRVRTSAGALHRFDERLGTLGLPRQSFELVLVFDRDGGAPLSIATFDEGFESRYRLCPFELRYAADNGVMHPVPLAARADSPYRPVTDLHSHFAGCVRGIDLVELGAEHGITYPRAFLDEAKIHTTNETSLADLDPSLRRSLARRLEIPLDRRVTFLEMERIYRLRSPLTKSKELFVPLCRRIASDYSKMGIRYVELSLGNVIEARVLRAIHREMPAIERETGVTVRFLAALWRHDDPEWDLDAVERIKTLRDSIYLAGIDVMGHETNSTRAFAPILRSIAEWAHHARPGFVVRVHAGESPSHPENVRIVLEAVGDRDVSVRIGHGLYGVDDETLAAIVARGAVVEFNLDSNVALNHLQSARTVPLRRYVEANARVVLGSDGYGIYQTSPADAARAALIAGLHRGHLEDAIAKAEREIIEQTKARELALPASFEVPDDPAPIHFTPAVAERRAKAIADRDRAMNARISEMNVPVVSPADVGDLRRGRTLVSIAGAWRHSWEALGQDERARIEGEMARFIEGLDPSEAVLVTGGTRFGVEGLVGGLATRRGITTIAAIVRETAPDALDPAMMSHVCFVAETLYDKAAGLYDLVSAHAGVCVFIAGGQIVSDEIQTARNLRLRHLLMDDVGGASSRHARERPACSFRTAAEILHAIRTWKTVEHAPHWFEGPNPTVDAVVIERRATSRVLLVLRDLDAPAEPGKWALPGGFIASSSRRGERFVATETEEQACVREVYEEAGLVLDASKLVRLGAYEGDQRDPRDDDRSWSRSTAFLVVLDEPETPAISGGDDASDVRWFALDELPSNLAFDHRRILDDARRALHLGT